MLFNSFSFILAFLPVTLAGFFLLSRVFGNEAAKVFLTVASLFFYACWKPAYVGIILSSILMTFLVSRLLLHANANGWGDGLRTAITGLGIAANLSFLGYFKYANFAVEITNKILGSNLFFAEILLPLGISFFTFQQCAFLLDLWTGKSTDYSFRDYVLFVSFFPQLIAGPIVHHREMMPQFGKLSRYTFEGDDFAVGTTLFSVGLFKKIILADNAAVYANAVFEATSEGQSISFIVAWLGAILYLLQLYFDFSGYSDMAVGLGRMFGIRLPLNFNSPLKACSIIDFWSRWHQTLTRFFTDYVYTPLVFYFTRRRLLRKSDTWEKGVVSLGAFPALVALPLLITMSLTGIWHGAGFQFVLFGLLHGSYLTVNHAFRNLCRLYFQNSNANSVWMRVMGRAVTFAAVVVSFVFFRAESVGDACVIVQSMFGWNGVALPLSIKMKLGEFGKLLVGAGVSFERMPGWGGLDMIGLMIGLLSVAWFMPNSQQWVGKYMNHSLGHSRRQEDEGTSIWSYRVPEFPWQRFAWKPNSAWGLVLAVLTFVTISRLSEPMEFLYFNF